MKFELIKVKANGDWGVFGVYETQDELDKAVDFFNEHRSKDGSEYFDANAKEVRGRS